MQNRRAAPALGFGAGVQITWTRMIMQGAPHCDFRYSLNQQGPEI